MSGTSPTVDALSPRIRCAGCGALWATSSKWARPSKIRSRLTLVECPLCVEEAEEVAT